MISVGDIKTYYAEAALVKYTLVKLGTNKDQVITCGVGERAIGVYMSDADAAIGDSAEIYLVGRSAELKISTAASAGNLLSSDASGQGKLGLAGEWSPALALEAGSIGDVIPVI